MKGLISVVVLTVSVFFSVTAYSDGIKTLSELGKSQDINAAELDKETSVYDRLKKAIADGTIKQGTDADALAKEFGPPVVELAEDGGTEKWVYKPGYVSYFEGEKIYIYVGSDNMVQQIETIGRK